MAYNFKNLADVELLNAMPEEANVLVEVNGTTKRAPLPEIPEVDVTAELVAKEALEEVPEGATVLAEVNGQIKRVPGAGLGGSGGGWDDYVAVIDAEFEDEHTTVTNDMLKFTYGSYEAIKAKRDVGMPVKILFRVSWWYGTHWICVMENAYWKQQVGLGDTPADYYESVFSYEFEGTMGSYTITIAEGDVLTVEQR